MTKHQDSFQDSQQESRSTDPRGPSETHISSGGDAKTPPDPGGQADVQGSSNRNSKLPEASNQDGSKDPKAPAQTTRANSAQVDPAS